MQKYIDTCLHSQKYDNDHDKLIYNNSTLFHICSEELSEDSVLDHCHLSGKFRDAAH